MEESSAASAVRACGLALAAGAAIAIPARAQNVMQRVNLGPNGVESDDESGSYTLHSISQDGRYVSFDSLSSVFMPGDTNGAWDVFVADRVTGTVVPISLDPTGNVGDSTSYISFLSADGRYVLFSSLATNLVANDTYGAWDSFVRDRDPDGNTIFDEGNATTERLSVASDGTQGDGDSFALSCSPDGNFVVFISSADDLVIGDTNGVSDVFVRDRAQGTMVRVSVASSGAQGDQQCTEAAISADGRYVGFVGYSTNLDPRDHNGNPDVFLHDSSTGTTTRVSGDPKGGDGNGYCYNVDVTEDGTLVAFDSFSNNLVANDTNPSSDVFVYDVATGVTTLESVDSAGVQGNDQSYAPAFSGDGGHVGFASLAGNLVAGDTNGSSDSFVRDLSTGETACVSVDEALQIGDSYSFNPSLSRDGSVVTYSSWADDLVGGDRNDTIDVFAVDRSIPDPVATWSNYGSGFPGTNEIPNLVAASNPVVGSSFSIDVDNSLGQWSVGLFVCGLASASFPTRAGGTWLVDETLLTFTLALPPGGDSLFANLPLDVGICGLDLYNQVIELDAGAAHGLSFTPGLQLTIGI